MYLGIRDRGNTIFVQRVPHIGVIEGTLELVDHGFSSQEPFLGLNSGNDSLWIDDKNGALYPATKDDITTGKPDDLFKTFIIYTDTLDALRDIVSLVEHYK